MKEAIMAQDYISAREQYELFLSKPGSQKLLDGYLIINENDKTFAVSTDSYYECFNFQAASYDNIDSIAINDGVQKRSIKMKDGDSGAAGAVFGALLFGPVGALAGGLATREDAQYGEYLAAENIGFTIMYTNTSHIDINVLNLCFNRQRIDYHTNRELYEKAKQLTIQIYEELYKHICPEEKTESYIKGSTHADAENSRMLEATNEIDLPSGNININPNNVEPTITRIELFLEDKEWDTAKAYAETALDFFPTDYRLYLFLLFADLQVSDYDELSKCTKSITENRYYKKVIRFADDDVIEMIHNCTSKADETAENEAAYAKAVQLMDGQMYAEAYQLFARLGEYKDAKERIKECNEKYAEYVAKKEREQKEFAEREKEANQITELLVKRNKLLRQSEKEGTSNRTSSEQLEILDDQLLKRADIIRNANGTYSFDAFAFPYDPHGDLFYSDSNEWMLIGRMENTILLLSKYSIIPYIKWRTYSITTENLNTIKMTGWNVNSFAGIIPPMISGFAHKQRSIISKFGLLSRKEVQEFLPDKMSRVLTKEKNKTKAIAWELRDNDLPQMIHFVNQNGDITESKKSSISLPTIEPRPAVWIDLNRLKPADSISFDDPNYEYVNYDCYSLPVPKYFVENRTTEAGKQILSGANGLQMFLTTAEEDPSDIDQKDGSNLISEDGKLLKTGSYHISAWSERMDNKTNVSLFYKSPDDFNGLFVKASYVPDGKRDIYGELLKGFFNAEKLEEKTKEKEELIEKIDMLLKKRSELLKAVNESPSPNGEKMNLIVKIERLLLDKAGICQNGNVFKFTHYRNLPREDNFYGINEWLLVGRAGGKVLLLSKYSELGDCVYRWGKDIKEVKWAKSIIYRRLNRYTDSENVLTRYFNYDFDRNSYNLPPDVLIEHFEKKHIHLFEKITMLSSEELERFLPKKEDRILYDKKSMQAVSWFLRDDVVDNNVSIVNTNGIRTKEKNSSILSDFSASVRPALWIDLERIKEIL